jgi:hypothetical protein
VDNQRGRKLSRAAMFLSENNHIVSRSDQLDVNTPGEALDAILSSMANDIQDLKEQITALKMKLLPSESGDPKKVTRPVIANKHGVVRPSDVNEYGDEP